MSWEASQSEPAPSGLLLPPPNGNEIELVVPGFKEKYVDPLHKLLTEGDPNEEIKEMQNLTVYSDWKDLPNFRFRLMLFPIFLQADVNHDISDFRISAYVEAAGKDDWPDNWVCYGTRFCIFIINHRNPNDSIFKRDTFNFSSTELDRGWQGIVPLSQILEHGFLNETGELTLRAGVYPMGAEVNRSSREAGYNCRRMTGFVGLQNHGATCYMNALLQSLYSITKFRKAVYLLDFKEGEMIGQKSYEIMKRLEPKKGDSFISSESPYDEQKSIKRKTTHNDVAPSGYPEVGMEDPVEPSSESNLDERECCAILMDEEEEQKKVPSVSLALQNLFYKLRYAPNAPPCKELMRSFGWDSSDMFTQQDSHELLKLLLDKMEEQMKGTPVEGSVKQMFEGEMETYIECIDIDYKSCRKETFEDIQLDIQGCSDIYESLKRLTEAEILSGDNMYEAEGHGKQRARKGIRFLKFPPVCVFLLKRFTFDLQRMDTVKLNDRFEFYKEIDLSPFCPGGGNYVLQAVSVHHGSINSGHYYAFAASDKGAWYRFDDEHVCKVSEYAVIGDNFGGEEPDCFNYCSPDDEINMRPFRRYKNYNAYILIYVLKDAVGEILGDCDPIKERYSMIERCRLQERLYAMRRRIRDRLNQFIKIKVFEKGDFEGHRFMDQPFVGWQGGKTVTFERSTTLSEALRHINYHVISASNRNELFSPEHYHVMGLSRSSNRFQCVADIKEYQNPHETLQMMVSLIRSDIFQVYDPTLYILHVPRQSHITPSLEPCPLLVVKYFDIFSERPNAENLICLDMVYVIPNRSISQIAAIVLRKLLRFMNDGVVNAHKIPEIEKCAGRLETIDTTGKSPHDLDVEIDKVMAEESIHINWYVELVGMYDTVAINKTLMEQHMGNGDLLVFNLRPTDAMRQLIEETDTQFTLKEDFEYTKPAIELGAPEEPFVYSSEEYMQSILEPGDDMTPGHSVFNELRLEWAKIAESEALKYHKANIFPIYDFPSFCDWRISGVTVTFKLYNPLEDLGTWMNCCTAVIGVPGSPTDPASKSMEDLQMGVGNVKTMKFTLDLRTPCKHVLRYVCWSMGVDPAHTLFFSHQPNKLESIWLPAASLDDFFHRDNSLGSTQKPFSELFATLGKPVRHDTDVADSVIRSNSINSNAQCSERSLESVHQGDMSNPNVTPLASRSTALAIPDLVPQNHGLASIDMENKQMGLPDVGYRMNLRSHSSLSSAVQREPNVIFMAVLPKWYRDFIIKDDGVSLNFVAQVFNQRVEIIASCMGKVPRDITVGGMCEMMSNLSKIKPKVNLRLVECISEAFVVVDPNILMRDMPHYTNNNIRNLFAAPLRLEPDLQEEEHELIQAGERVPLTVIHQTPDHENFGHPFQVLVSTNWTLGEIKNLIKDKLCLPKQEWDRWSFFQQMDGYNRTWKANDDKLDWDKSQDIKLLAEHPRPYAKSRSYNVMRIA